MEKPDIEGLKELLRVVVLAILPIVIDALVNNQVSSRAIIIACGIAALKAIDKWLHTIGKEEADPSLTKGLTRF